jgi:hypothetical protein
MDPERMEPSAALVAFAEPLLSGRRVVVFGSATSGTAQNLVERGARLVHVYDADLSRVAEATAKGVSRNISYAPLGQSGVMVRDGAFDVGIVENLADCVDFADLLQKLRRALSARGAALIASRNPDLKRALCPSASESKVALGYYEMYDAIAEQFDHTRMFGQAPFVGYAVAEFAPDSTPEVAFDSALVPGGSEEPEWFVALASHHQLDVSRFLVVQYPFAHTVVDADQGKLELELQRAGRSRDDALARLERLEAELADAHAGSGSRDATEVAELTRRLDAQSEWVDRLESRAQSAEARAEEVLSELTRERASRQSMAERVPERLPDPEAERDLDALEALLKDRAERVLQLERDLKATERLGEDLVRQLAALRAEPRPTVTAETIAREAALAELVRENATLTADLASLRWTIEELETKLEPHSPS